MSIVFSQNVFRLESDMETPIGYFIRTVGDNHGIFLESVEVDGRWGRYSIIATDFLLLAACDKGVLKVTVADEDLQALTRFNGQPFDEGLRCVMEEIRIDSDTTEECPAITRGLYGYLGYGLAGLFTKKLASRLPPEEAQACLALPGTLVLFDHLYNSITRFDLTLSGRSVTSLPSLTPPRPRAAAARENALNDKKNYIAAVTEAKEMIRQGEAIQVVLSTSFQAPLAEGPFSLYRRLRRYNPSPYMFYMRLPDITLLGSSPEVMVSCTENVLKLCPIAGTRPRSEDAAEDAFFSDDLMQDLKEKAEHVMLVDLGRNDLGRIATPGSVQVERFMEVERFSHVMHLTSRIRADLAPGKTAVDVLKATFPAGTVSGAPKVRAMEMIADMEQAPRGPYAGAIGWLGLDKEKVNLDLGITIRSLWIRDGLVNWQVGAGIVYDSVPEREWTECLNKSAVIRKVIYGTEMVAE
ncbi:MAG: anthranilate synthase component I family protein [Methylobacteriaceae bacterium]|nr:anthranilate synthase component I family protein [Methylobacteriaceae bacterium]